MEILHITFWVNFLKVEIESESLNEISTNLQSQFILQLSHFYFIKIKNNLNMHTDDLKILFQSQAQ